MALKKIITEARRRDLQDKIIYHLVNAGVAVMAESETTENHAVRLVYAGVILRGGANVFQYTLAVVTNTTIATAIEDGTDYDDDLAFVVNSLFNAFANAEGV